MVTRRVGKLIVVAMITLAFVVVAAVDAQAQGRGGGGGGGGGKSKNVAATVTFRDVSGDDIVSDGFPTAAAPYVDGAQLMKVEIFVNPSGGSYLFVDYNGKKRDTPERQLGTFLAGNQVAGTSLPPGPVEDGGYFDLQRIITDDHVPMLTMENGDSSTGRITMRFDDSTGDGWSLQTTADGPPPGEVTDNITISCIADDGSSCTTWIVAPTGLHRIRLTNSDVGYVGYFYMDWEMLVEVNQ